MGDFDRDAARNKDVEQCRGILDGDIEAVGKRGGGDDGRRRQDVDCRGGMRIAPPAADRGAGGKPLPLQPA